LFGAAWWAKLNVSLLTCENLCRRLFASCCSIEVTVETHNHQTLLLGGNILVGIIEIRVLPNE